MKNLYYNLTGLATYANSPFTIQRLVQGNLGPQYYEDIYQGVAFTDAEGNAKIKLDDVLRNYKWNWFEGVPVTTTEPTIPEPSIEGQYVSKFVSSDFKINSDIIHVGRELPTGYFSVYTTDYVSHLPNILTDNYFLFAMVHRPKGLNASWDNTFTINGRVYTFPQAKGWGSFYMRIPLTKLSGDIVARSIHPNIALILYTKTLAVRDDCPKDFYLTWIVDDAFVSMGFNLVSTTKNNIRTQVTTIDESTKTVRDIVTDKYRLASMVTNSEKYVVSQLPQNQVVYAYNVATDEGFWANVEDTQYELNKKPATISFNISKFEKEVI